MATHNPHEVSATGGAIEAKSPQGDAIAAGVEEAIQKELAPTVAASLLQKADHPGEPGSPAMKCVAAGLSQSDDVESVRFQFIFESGTVLPVDVPRTACEAFARQLLKQLAG